MEMCLWITVLLSQTEINNVNLISTLSNSHQEVIGFNITMNERFGMDVFNSGDL